MIKHETIYVDGTVIYCDRCKKRGYQVAYDNAEDVIMAAEQQGWQVGDGPDLCPACKPKEAD